jgi:glutamine amidotransferase PdxT
LGGLELYVKSWLLDAMTREIRSLFIRSPTIKEIWNTIKQTYSVSQDASKAYQLYCEVIYGRKKGHFLARIQRKELVSVLTVMEKIM